MMFTDLMTRHGVMYCQFLNRDDVTGKGIDRDVVVVLVRNRGLISLKHVMLVTMRRCSTLFNIPDELYRLMVNSGIGRAGQYMQV